VGRMAGESVMRGAHVFAPGLLAVSPGEHVGLLMPMFAVTANGLGRTQAAGCCYQTFSSPAASTSILLSSCPAPYSPSSFPPARRPDAGRPGGCVCGGGAAWQRALPIHSRHSAGLRWAAGLGAHCCAGQEGALA
jgi:hypothetical protein